MGKRILWPTAKLLALAVMQAIGVAHHSGAQGTGDGDVMHIAIVGAGITGAATAFHLHNLSLSSPGRPLSVTIFESAPRAGGQVRTTSLPGSWEKLEVGAAHFYDDDWCLMDAARAVNLSTRTTRGKGNAHVWDGESFARDRVCHASFFWDLDRWFDPRPLSRRRRREAWQRRKEDLELEWRYRRSPDKFQRLVAGLMERWKMFGANATFDNVGREFSDVSLIDGLGASARDFLRGMSVDEEYQERFIEPCLRDAYGSTLDESSVLDAAMAAGALRSKAVSIVGGNALLVEDLIRRSGAELHLGSSVTSVTHGVSHLYRLAVASQGSTSVKHGEFDAVFFTGSSQHGISSPWAGAHKPSPEIESHIAHYSISSNQQSLEPFGGPVPLAPLSFLTGQDSKYLGERDVRSLYTHTQFWIDRRGSDPDPECDQFDDVVSVNSKRALSDNDLLRIVEHGSHDSAGVGWFSWIDKHSWVRQNRNWTEVGVNIEGSIEIRPGLYNLGHNALDTAEMGCRMGQNGARLLHEGLISPKQ
ncbi:hypothetical protein JX265_011608 [Neoarthrinium moseri]|uniref:Amine oxidase domain-containing protein n=1 Tax=Neoarthrinium moseri TaxID=1658444 RepID=A0A9P9WBU1_9PEZI|nr:hypothetical protein JX265_011608 [Neoarthrinium moseri]